MATLLAYFTVVLIWATTPLAIQWSSDSLHFMTAALMRMSLALTIALMIHALFNRAFFSFGQHWKIYFAASLGIFPNLPVVYWAAQFIPSGLVAIIYATSPFLTGLMTLALLKKNPFNFRRILALSIAVAGMMVIFHHQFHADLQQAWAVMGVFLSCFLFSFSSVLVKKIQAQHGIKPIGAFNQVSGALLFSMPGLLVSWWFLDGNVAVYFSLKSAGAVIYLALLGSLVGGALFFYVLQRMTPASVSLITLMTPVLALLIGKFLAGEALSAQIILGVALVLIALLLYMQWSINTWSESFTVWFANALRKRELDNVENPDGELQKIKGSFIRHK